MTTSLFTNKEIRMTLIITLKKRWLVCLVFAVLGLTWIQITTIMNLESSAYDDNHQQQPPLTPTRKKRLPPIATGLGMTLEWKSEKPLESSVHCVGENFSPKYSWGYRSCQFRRLCWQFQSNNNNSVVLLQSQEQHLLEQMWQFDLPSKYAHFASRFFNISVSTSAFASATRKTSKWFPNTLALHDLQVDGYYQLPDDIVLIPITLHNTRDDYNLPMTEWLFDFFLPLYNLLAMFDLQDKKVLLINLNDYQSSSSCKKEENQNATKLHKLLPIFKNFVFLTNPTNILSMHSDPFQLLHDNDDDDEDSHRSRLVCAPHGAVGIGALNDHGRHKRSRDKRQKDYLFVQNTGRGPIFFYFRNYILQNLNIPHKTTLLRPWKVTIAISSSDKSGQQTFQSQVDLLRNHYASDAMTVEHHHLFEMPIQKQLEIAAHTTIFISMMGEHAMPAFFLPRGATLILYYNDKDEFVKGSSGYSPVRLDWDVWNNLSHIRVHWLPLSTMSTEQDQQILLQLIQNELLHLDETYRSNHEKASKEQTKENFNGKDVYFRNSSVSSAVHCLGGNFQPEAFIYRSCEFQNLCYDLESKQLVLAPPQSQLLLEQGLLAWNHPKAQISTSMAQNEVSFGNTVRLSTSMGGWFPTIKVPAPASYYDLLAEDVVWIPFVAEQPNLLNPGHLLLDFFLPFYSLLAMYDLEDKEIFLTNLDNLCEPEISNQCWRFLNKFLPYLGISDGHFKSTHSSELFSQDLRSRVVCSRHGVAGMGMLTDHGLNRHGQRKTDYADVYNSGRGVIFYDFRQFILGKMGIPDGQNPAETPSKTVTFSINSSKNPSRRRDFANHIAMTKAISDNRLIVSIQQYDFATLTLEEQVRMAQKSLIFISTVGGSASIATFLPRGATLILFYNDIDDFVHQSPNGDGFPCMLDWDCFNNLAHIRVHWMSIRTMDEERSIRIFVELIKNDLLHPLL